MKSLLITATDTNAGKTVLTAALASYWFTHIKNKSLGIIKPVQSGLGDREFYQDLFTLDQSLEELNPLYFSAPLAPPIAARKENAFVDLGKAWNAYTSLSKKNDFVLVEALGGLGSPVTDELTVADLARDWGLPTVLVVPVKLGAIAHTVANVALARYNKVKLIGIILNCPQSDIEITDLTPIDLIESLTNIPVLGCLPYMENIKDQNKLAQIASNLELEKLLIVTNK
jgi:dethiobiotin synthetase